MHALPIMILALCALALGYRYYSAFLAAKVAVLEDARITPAHRLNDGQNYHPTNQWVLFGHHFAAISGAGPLVGPVLAAQFGFMPGLLWLVIGVVLAGATQDFLILAASVRRNGRSLAEIAREEIGPVAGVVCAVAILFIIVNALAGLGLVVVKALGGEELTFPAGSAILMTPGHPPTKQSDRIWKIPGPVQIRYGKSGERLTVQEDFEIDADRFGDAREAGVYPLADGSRRLIRGSSWGVFTIACTVPIALFVGLWMYKIRKGRVVEASLIGAVAVLACTGLGSLIPGSPLESLFSLSKNQVTVAIAFYGFIASVLPVWLLLCPRDYLSSFLKIGTIAGLVLGVLIVNPPLHMPGFTAFCAGGGPIVPGKVFPFVFITIMCGAISGFHALVSSGTTPKMLDKESQARTIGYGAMLIEGLVGVVALIAACSLEPGDYFSINVDLARQPGFHDQMVRAGTAEFGEPHELGSFEKGVGEQLQGRSGGAVSLAVGISKIFSGIPGFSRLVSFWYHFAIMFEALFILTTIDTGTRIARFIVQELGGRIHPALGRQDWMPGAVVSTLLVVVCWSYFIWTGSIDTIWPMFGIANQLLAAIALSVATTVMINAGRGRYALVTILPMAFVMTTTLTAAWQLVHDRFLPALDKFPADRFKWGLNIVLTAVMVGSLGIIVVDSIRRWRNPLPANASEPLRV
ncbi:MAG TPA: carbon starvation CstA family protein [Planctomycetota bacterium]|nr:carbon starvation CstA family protein [Planctomycetota bacterium]